MKLSDFKEKLKGMDTIKFLLPNGQIVPEHFHITEAGLTTKHFIDCGGTIRKENMISFQLWEAADYDHRLSADKLLKIIDLSEKALKLDDHDVEIEYQAETIGRYGLDFNGKEFILTTKRTACLANDKCGTGNEKVKVSLSELNVKSSSCCAPGSGCC